VDRLVIVVFFDLVKTFQDNVIFVFRSSVFYEVEVLVVLLETY